MVEVPLPQAGVDAFPQAASLEDTLAVRALRAPAPGGDAWAVVRAVTEDGLERTFATNHMAYFVLTDALRERLAAAAPARVVNTASDAHRGQLIDFNDLQMAR